MKQKQKIKLVASSLVIFWLLIIGPAWSQSSASIKALILDTNHNAGQLITEKTEENGKTKFSTLVPKIERKCGEPDVNAKVDVPLEQGYTYIRHELKYALREPSDKPVINGCKDVWVPQMNIVKLECWCRPDDRCREEEPGKWRGPKTEVQARIIIYTTKVEGR